ncbi:MAG: tetratricopeptide repeat protein [Bacteroidota bacterium]
MPNLYRLVCFAQRCPGFLARRGAGVLLGVAALCAGLLGTGCEPSNTPDPAALATAPLATATYVGDAACVSCHGDISAPYAATNKAHALTRFDVATAPERFGANGRSPVVYNAAFDLSYEAFVRGDTLYQREFRRDPDGTISHDLTYAASHVIGSGHATRSYLMTVEAEGGGYLTEMPLTWYVERGLWAMSPGYTNVNNRFSRAITEECIACHAGVPDATAFTVNHFTDTDGGISCERCHGPASAHVAAWQQDPAGQPSPSQTGTPDPTIVNPAHLSIDLQLDVCQQCHLEGTTVFQPGETPLSYRPGTPLRAHRTVFATASSLDEPESFGIASHVVRMRLSACFEETQGTPEAMTCTTCHDPHRPEEALPADHFNVTCRSCHGAEAHEAACSRPNVDASADDARVMAAQGDCVSCHLQKAGTSDIPHVTFTDHWIRRELPEARAAVETALIRPTRTTPFRLVDVTAADQGAGSADQGSADQGSADASEAQELIDSGLATFKFYEATHTLPAYLPRVTERLRRGLALGGRHPDAQVVLGRALAAMDSTATALAVLQEAAAATPDYAWAHYWLGHTLHAAGRSAEAVTTLDRAVALAPKLVEAHLKRAEALNADGRATDAVAAWRTGLALDPEHHPGGWNNLGFALLQQNDLAGAEAALGRAVALDPDFAVARVNLGTTYLVAAQQDPTRLGDAADQFERALVADPAYAPALGNLGVIRAQQGRTAEARQLFERLLALNPTDQRARAYLQQLN